MPKTANETANFLPGNLMSYYVPYDETRSEKKRHSLTTRRIQNTPFAAPVGVFESSTIQRLYRISILQSQAVYFYSTRRRRFFGARRTPWSLESEAQAKTKSQGRVI